MSNSLLEAMSVGLAVLVSGTGGNVNLVSDVLTGKVVAENSASAWADAVVAMLTDADARKRMGLAAREHIQASFSIESVVTRYQDLYVRLTT